MLNCVLLYVMVSFKLKCFKLFNGTVHLSLQLVSTLQPTSSSLPPTHSLPYKYLSSNVFKSPPNPLIFQIKTLFSLDKGFHMQFLWISRHTDISGIPNETTDFLAKNTASIQLPSNNLSRGLTSVQNSNLVSTVHGLIKLS